jgi:hypothetical protein
MTVTITPTVNLASTPPSVSLAVNDSTGANSSLTVQRMDADGVLRPVRTTDGNPLPMTVSGSTRVGSLVDYEPPYGTSVYYTTTEVPSVASASVTVTSSRAWLVHPGVPSLSLPITIADLSARKRAVSRGVFYPQGRGFAVVQTAGARKAPEYTLSIYTAALSDLNAMLSLLADASALLLNVPATNGWGVGAEYVSIGDVDEGRAVKPLGYSDRVWVLPCTVVDRPSGGTGAAWAMSNIRDGYALMSNIRDAFPKMSNIAAGR